MGKFAYVVKNKEGKDLKGVVQAVSKEAAVESLRSKGFIIISLGVERTGIFSSMTFLPTRKKKI